MPNYPGAQSHMFYHPAFFLPILLPSPHPTCPSLTPPPPPQSLPSGVLRIHLQIKQIYHSVTEAEKGGSVWNALAQTAGKGPKRSAMPPCMLPCCPCSCLLRLALFACFHDPRSAPAASLTHYCLTCTNQTHLSQQSSSRQPRTAPEQRPA